MLFGLVNAAVEAQRQCNHDFWGPTGEGWVGRYMKHVLIVSRTVLQHLQHLRKVSKRLQKKQWHAKTKKYSFSCRKIDVLWFRVFAAGVQSDRAKIETIRTWSISIFTRTDIQVLGFASCYLNFLPGLAHISAVLTDLL